MDVEETKVFNLPFAKNSINPTFSGLSYIKGICDVVLDRVYYSSQVYSLVKCYKFLGGLQIRLSVILFPIFYFSKLRWVASMKRFGGEACDYIDILIFIVDSISLTTDFMVD
ncbi:hypothetical protein IEQ34_005249 [Dendrobium chrysotoxum]|uniref:Uncharacterized protein n=1 Tax=Dendrobium chrysotoxum TaxID=161865 RepID=A0AAV7H8B3_DENCH|nr:hypothetical protein IEQ34_005249 [Dendrobium chrysotoxum]